MSNNVAFSNVKAEDKYKVVARYMDGVKVLGYHLIDSYGNGQPVKKDIVEQMAMEKQIINCIAQRYKGAIVMKGTDCKLTALPVIDANSGKVKGADQVSEESKNKNKLEITARITKGKVTVGYVLRDRKGVEHKVKREDVLTLARDKKIINARAQMFNGELVLRGIKFELAQLPNIRI